jgi:hypothetical protein
MKRPDDRRDARALLALQRGERCSRMFGLAGVVRTDTVAARAASTRSPAVGRVGARRTRSGSPSVPVPRPCAPNERAGAMHAPDSGAALPFGAAPRRDAGRSLNAPARQVPAYPSDRASRARNGERIEPNSPPPRPRATASGASASRSEPLTTAGIHGQLERDRGGASRAAAARRAARGE